MKKICVVTGLGMVSSIGNNLDECWNNAKNGVFGVKEVTSFDTTGCYTKNACEAKFDLESSEGVGKDKVTAFCITAAKEAVKDSEFVIEKGNSSRVGLIIGSCTGGAITAEKVHRRILAVNDINCVSKEDIFRIPIASLSNDVAESLGIEGYMSNISNACAAGTIGIGYACDLINKGIADVVVVCGGDTVSSLCFSGFHALKALAENTCAPLSKSDGISLGEGSGAIVIESIESAHKRNAKIYCKVESVGVSSDAYHITAPHPQGKGQKSSMMNALTEASVNAREIGYINAHGTGTPINDSTEINSIFEIFGENVMVSSTKAMTGHCLGAAGTIEAIFTIKSICDSVIPPTVNFDHDAHNPNEGVKVVADKMVYKELRYAISNSFAFGGNNASVLFAKNDVDSKIRYNEDKRTVITGLGIINHISESVDEYVDKISSFAEGRNIAEIVNEDIVSVDSNPGKVKPSLYRKIDRIGKLLIISGNMAINDSKIDFDTIDKTNVGCINGTSDGPVTSIAKFQDGMITNGLEHGSAFIFPNTVYNAAGGYLSICMDIEGYSATVANGYLAGLESICYGQNVIGMGRQKYILASGTDELTESVQKMYSIIDAERCNKISEGSTTLLLESYENAIERDADIYAEVLGYGMFHNPIKSSALDLSGNSIKEAVLIALKNSGIGINDIGAIVGCTACSDLMYETEKEVYSVIFENANSSIPVIEIKNAVGECRAASSALQAAHAGLILSDRISKETLCEYSVGNGSVSEKTDYVLVTGYSYGGSAIAVVLKRVCK